MNKYYDGYIGAVITFLLGLANWHGVAIGNPLSLFSMVLCFVVAVMILIRTIFD